MVIGGSAGGVLSATIAYHFTSILKDYTTIFGCVLLYPLLANWNYNGKYKERLLGWDELAETDMPIINLKNCREVCGMLSQTYFICARTLTSEQKSKAAILIHPDILSSLRLIFHISHRPM